MKKLFIALIILLFSVSFVHAVTIASGSVTRANSRLSLVDGTAFVDFSAADVLTDYIGKRIVITDSAGKKAVGYIKAAGTGETLGDELATNGGFDSDTTGWSIGNSALLASVAGGESGNCLQITENGVASPYASKGMSVVQGALYKSNYSVKQGTSSTYRGYITGSSIYESYPVIVDRTSTSEWVAQGPWYRVPIGTGNAWFVLYNIAAQGSGLTHLFDSATFKQVLTPSATGVTITSTPNGTTYNWTSIESGFNYNDASGYTYTIESVGGGGSLMLLGVGK